MSLPLSLVFKRRRQNRAVRVTHRRKRSCQEVWVTMKMMKVLMIMITRAVTKAESNSMLVQVEVGRTRRTKKQHLAQLKVRMININGDLR